MHLRFAKDRRTLVWAFGLFPLVPLGVLGKPTLAWFLWPLALYASYCSGVLTHNHTHVPVFRERRLNRLYAVWLSFFYGCPIFAWIPTHHRNHHRYVNGPGDHTRTTRYSQQNTLWAAISYPARSSAWQWPEVRDYALRMRRRGGPAYTDVIAQTAAATIAHVALLAAAMFLNGALGALALFVCFTLPAALAPAWMMFTNYLQHVECDPASPDNHSRNFVNRVFNWFTFDNGYHTVHHEQPSLHWSLLREAHLLRAHGIDPRLNQDSIFGYCFSEYVTAPLARRFQRSALVS
ncbi:MAG: fatty acid desaturase family protein [Myxococcota bacterium]